MSKYLAVYGKPRYLGLVEHEEEIEKGETLVVESVRGKELAVVVGAVSEEQETLYRQMRSTLEHSDGMAKNSEPVVTDLTFVDFASDGDLDDAEEYRSEEKNILASAKKLLLPHNLDMKLIDVEFLHERRKLFFYFSSEQRVDFRAYVRDLAREFKTRIELRQVGVRDEAKIIRGVGPCGRPCCCSYWLNQFSPICIKMVKEQNLALNPAKISGICGRLMCCMCYEHEVYREAWEGLPNPGSKIKTPAGNVVVSGIDISSNCLRCFIPNKGEVKVAKDKFEEFKEVVSGGGEWAEPEDIVEEPSFKMQDIFPKCMMPRFEASETPAESAQGKRCPQKVERMGGNDAERGNNQGAGGAKKKRRRSQKREDRQPRETAEGAEAQKPKRVEAAKRPKEGAAQGVEERAEKRQQHRRRRPAPKKNDDGAQTAKAEVQQ
ncbi:PSP1 domain-containing protein [Synergistes jonesii]|uniref:PSP1 C-terminal domain-containing protein n=1 Tax=Synergistes jonesii TaxID=2754 RepID=A0A073IPH2_9BACT|nr:regulatory iron-sulfur-containing complex subunit RicT [Synergistes jonesii]KEJ91381.1 hypothetical protein EH55_11090 [Synergistes jonesii]OFB60443.1 hypothetical protein JS73_11960 [Synergistes jonesii]OFB61197.1 hypothetical protein JS79_12110 [Synergistes jonesii]OFB62849.1 hypothetical protein JS72_07320 [Synergistes jonesii]OFB66654.1 hypothetical protein JS78_11980 [Synergistes jonesii]